MIIAFLFLAGAAAMMVLAWRAMRRAGSRDWVRAADTRLVVETGPGESAPRLRLEAGGTRVFGPVAAQWAMPGEVAQALGNREGEAGRLGGPVPAGQYRVAAMLDLTAADVLASGERSLDEPLAKALGERALLLETLGGGAPPLLLHGRARESRGSLGGIALAKGPFDALLARLGDPQGLRVEVLRRRIQRAGWGTERAQRRRGS